MGRPRCPGGLVGGRPTKDEAPPAPFALLPRKYIKQLLPNMAHDLNAPFSLLVRSKDDETTLPLLSFLDGVFGGGGGERPPHCVCVYIT